MVICTSDSGRKLYEIEEYPDYEYIAGYYAWDGIIYKKMKQTDNFLFTERMRRARLSRARFIRRVIFEK